VNALEITDAVQLVVPPRWSETVTTPSGPLIVLEVVDATCDPSETVSPVGALIESPPAVRVKLVGVIAWAGSAVVAASAVAALARSKKVRIMMTFRCCRERGQKLV
jgi:hypothetical protein